MRKLLTVLFFIFFNIISSAFAEKSCSDHLNFSWSKDSKNATFTFKSTSSKTIYITQLGIYTSNNQLMKSVKRNSSKYGSSANFVLIVSPFGTNSHSFSISNLNPDLTKSALGGYNCTYTQPKRREIPNLSSKKEKSWFKWWYLLFALPLLGMITQAYEDNEKNKKTKSKTTVKESKPKEEPKVENSGPQMTGTAFFIDKKGHLITNFHVVANSSSRLKIIYEGQEYKARILAKDETLDLALIKVSVKNKTFIEISDKVIKKMQSIVAAGYPALHLSDDLKLTSGIISSLKGIGNNSALIQIDAALNPGNSGGPIIDKNKGHLAAVAVARMEGSHYQSINYGIKASRVKEFVESNNITLPYKKTNPKDKKNKLDISDVLETSTVLIYH